MANQPEDKALQHSILRLLTPLIRTVLRWGMSHAEFSELAKQVFVSVADQDFALPGKKQTRARVAMLTGIQRKEVSRIQAMTQSAEGDLDAAYNRALRVTSGWREDPDFCDDGVPRPLALNGERGFSELVKRYSGDLTARSVLDELLRVGTIVETEADLYRLMPDAVHVPKDDAAAQLNIMGRAGADLLSTMDHNLLSPEKRLQLTVAYDNLPGSAVRRFQALSHDRSLTLLKSFDRWLAEHDRDQQSLPDEPDDRYRAGIGIYYFEEPSGADQ